MKIRIWITAILIFRIWGINAQTEPARSLRVEDFYLLVKEYHPVAKQAALISARGDFEIMAARGAFDPKLISNYQNKQFEDKRYFDVWNSYLHLPTRLNVDFKVGYERNSGVFLNPERSTPNAGLYYAGISVPIGQGLLVNTRNIGLKKGKITSISFRNQAKIVLNNLLLEANNTYWLWFEAYQKRKLVSANLGLISMRFEGIRAAAINEEMAPIDSTEALIQVQQWRNNLNKAALDLVNSQLLLQNFLWNNDLDIELYNPILIENNALSEMENYEELSVRHPELESVRLTNAMLALDRKMSAEQLKPTLNLNYNFLLSEQNKVEEHAFLSNNYKAGVDFSFPLFLRKERAKLKSVNLKQQENELKLNHKIREITNKVNQYYNKCLTLTNMIQEQQRMIENYTRLLDGERSKFANGESSIFLINNRENKRITAEIKLIELQAEYGKTLGKLKWSSGIFVQD